METYLLFIDESGDTGDPGKESSTNFLIIGGVIIPSKTWRYFAEKLSGLKKANRINPNTEVK